MIHYSGLVNFVNFVFGVNKVTSDCIEWFNVNLDTSFAYNPADGVCHVTH